MIYSRVIGAVAALAVAVLGVLSLGSPAQAQGDQAPLSIAVEVTADCGEVTVTYTNTTEWPFWGDYRLAGDEGFADSTVPGLNFSTDQLPPPDEWGDVQNHGVTPDQELTEAPFAGEAFGLQYHPVLIREAGHDGSTRVVTLSVTEDTTVEARIWRGPIQTYYVPWTAPVEVKACPEPAASPSPSASPDPTTSPAPGQGGGDDADKPGLPVTGSAPLKLAAAAGGLGAAGLAAVVLPVWWQRRRRNALIDAAGE